MVHSQSRRRLLRNLMTATSASAVVPAAWGQRKFDKSPFGLGVASGSATHDSVVLWTRLFDQGLFGSSIPNETIAVKWQMASDPEFKDLVRSGVAPALPGLAHSVHAEVSGLPSNRWFYYRFLVEGASSPVGKTRTFAAPGELQESMRVAFASCQHFELGFFGAYKHLVNDKPDLVLFLGDYIYEYPRGKTGVRSVDAAWCLSLEDYRRRYAIYREDRDLQGAHAACPWLLIWDDHEVQNDYAGVQLGLSGPAVPDFLKRRAAAYQAYYEHMPLKASTLVEGLAGLEKGAEMRIYDQYRFGNLLGVTMLDTRQYRHPQVCTPGGKAGSGQVELKDCPALTETDRSLLGPEQEKWLARQFDAAGSSVWNVIGQSTLFGQRLSTAQESPKIWNDGWDGYPAARTRFTDLLVSRKVSNPVLLGGDIHENWVGYVKSDYGDPNSGTLGFEFCGTSISSFDGHEKTLPARLRRNPHFVFAEASRKGYGLADFSAKELVVSLRVISDHRQREPGVETLATFRVKAGTLTMTVS